MKTRETEPIAFPDDAELAALRAWYAGLGARAAVARYLGDRKPRGASARGAMRIDDFISFGLELNSSIPSRRSRCRLDSGLTVLLRSTLGDGRYLLQTPSAGAMSTIVGNGATARAGPIA
jgi:hypothetical protein